MKWFLLAVLAAPLVSYFIYRLAKGLGFLDPPWNAEHEQRRTIVAALYAFLLFLPIFLFGYANAWPRVWKFFGIVNGVTLLIFLGLGATAAWRLWKLRHPKNEPAAPVSEPGDQAAGKPLL